MKNRSPKLYRITNWKMESSSLSYEGAVKLQNDVNSIFYLWLIIK